MSSLLAVDVGLRTGLALYGRDGRLRWYRSRNFGNATRLRGGVQAVLRETPDLEWLVLEGGGPLADIWTHEAQRRGVLLRTISAEDWRRSLLYPRQHRNGPQAKHSADIVARRVIAWSQARRPTSLRHDAAEAILIGLWGLVSIGWLKTLPTELHHET
ncbi:MAG TPA: hypothetical protein PLL20_06625 [Phycisphaerae bacterium]|nr:hypothetical protein [Phycisphaerae bacterium]HRR85559.1 hypothetical protein [Phycisphaerae bacterium]